MFGKLLGLVLIVAALAVSCSNSKPLLHPGDPFDDPFFHEGLGSGTSSLDEIMHEPAPSVGWLGSDGPMPPPGHAEDGAAGSKAKLNADGEGVLLEAEGEGGYVPHHHHAASAGEDDSDEANASNGEKSFSDKAQEASLATMSILMGLGMAALPFLIGT